MTEKMTKKMTSGWSSAAPCAILVNSDEHENQRTSKPWLRMNRLADGCGAYGERAT
jgi:hypothetical protein